MKKETIIWQLIVTILGLILVVTLNIYFQDYNQIDSLSKYAKCISDMKKAFPYEDRTAFCSEILNYQNIRQ